MKQSHHDRRKEILASETGTVIKDPGGRVNICLVYPNTYRVGMSNLGFTGLYTLLNNRNDVFCERAFIPDEKEWYLKEKGERGLSLETGRPLKDFDVIGFSVSFENDYPNVLRLLHAARIGLTHGERDEQEPFIIMGGPCAFMNPEPLAVFMDAVFIGEAEEMIDEFIGLLKEGWKRQDILHALAAKEGFYVPGFYDPVYSPLGTILQMKMKSSKVHTAVKRRYVPDLDSTILASCLRTENTEFGSMYLIEAMRGCPFSCRFCAAGHVYNPPRQRKAEVLNQEIAGAKERGQKVGLIAPSLTDYRSIEEVLSIEDVHFSITSLRASRRSADIIGLIRGKRSVSIAPEAGSQRLRDVINKKITEEDILTTAGLIFEKEIKILRLYFMVGLPTETDTDIKALIALVKKIRGLSRKGMISVTLSVFVPKPFTPFQWHTMSDEKTVRKRIESVKKGLLIKGVRVSHDVIKDAYMQGLFAVGDRRVGRVLVEMTGEKNWQKASRAAGIDQEFYIFREKNYDEILPWDMIDNGVDKSKLWKEYWDALSKG